MNKFKEATDKFVKLAINPDLTHKILDHMDDYFNEICEIKPSFKDMVNNPKETMVWEAVKKASILTLIGKDIFVKKSIEFDCVESAISIALQDLALVVKYYERGEGDV